MPDLFVCPRRHCPPGDQIVISRKVVKWERGDIRWEAMVFTGRDDWRIGVSWDWHPLETSVNLHLPCLCLVIQRNR